MSLILALKKAIDLKKFFTAFYCFIIIFSLTFGNYPFDFAPVKTAEAAFNKQINYQGKLTTPANIAVADGTYNMEFKLYTASTGGVALWTETDTTTNRVQVTNGIFSVMLGNVASLAGIDFNQTLYLGVNIGGTATSPVWDGEMSPRKILGAVPAAFEAKNSQTLGNLNNNQFLRSDAANSTSTASTYLTVTQNGSGKIAEFFGPSAASALSILSNGNVGINATTPSAKLDIRTGAQNSLYVENVGDINNPTAIFKNNQAGSYASIDVYGGSGITNANKFQFGQYATGDAFYYLVGNNNLDFFTNSTNRIRITGAGNVILSSLGTGLVKSTSGTLSNAVAGTDYQAPITAGTGLSFSGATLNSVFTESGANIYNNNAGNVGIGTSTPGAKLFVQGGGFSGSGISNNSAYALGASSIAADVSIYSYGNICTGNGSGNCTGVGGIVLGAANTSASTNITGTGNSFFGGNLGIGTTSPLYKLDISRSVAAQGIVQRLVNTNTTSGATVGQLFGVYNGNTGLLIEQSSNAVGPSWASGSYDAFIHTGQAGSKLHFASNNSATPQMTISGGNVGIGTTSPGQKLHVYEGASGASAINTSSGLIIEDAGATGLSILTPLASTGSIYFGNPGNNISGGISYDNSTLGMSFKTGGSSNQMVITSSGNVGIGTTSPSNLLHVAGSARIDTQLNFTNNGTIGQGTSVGDLRISASGSNLEFYQGASERMRIQNGNVGIGTTTPANKLDVVGTIQIEGISPNILLNPYGSASENSQLSIAGGRAAFGYDGGSAGTAYVQAAGGRDVRILTNISTEVARFTSAGNVGIGTTSPVAKLDLYNGGFAIRDSSFSNNTTRPAISGGQTVDDFEIRAFGSVASGDHGLLRLRAGGGTSANASSYIDISGFSQQSDMNNTLVFGTAGAERLRINSTGDVGIGTTSPTGRFQVNGGDSYFGDSTNTARNIALVRSGTVVGGMTTANGVFSLFGGSALNQSHLTINSSGNIGIGTTDPGVARLAVTGGPVYINNGNTVVGNTFFTKGNAIFDSGSTGVIPVNIYGRAGQTADLFRIGSTGSTGDVLAVTAGGNVGIGTTSPAATFSVNGNGYFTGLVGIGGTASSYLHIKTPAANTNALAITDNTNYTLSAGYAAAGLAYFGGNGGTAVSLRANGAEAIRISTTGNVGIGTTSPYAKLSVVGDLALTGGIYDNNSTRGTSGQILLTTGSGVQWVATSTLGFLSSSAIASGTQGQFPFYNAAGTNLTATSSLFLAQSGNLGIGSINPGYKLDVTGTGNFSGTVSLANNGGGVFVSSETWGRSYIGNVQSMGLITMDNTNTSNVLWLTSNTAGIGTNGNNGSKFSVNGGISAGSYYNIAAPTNGMIVSGNVGIGTSSPSVKLEVVGDIKNTNNALFSAGNYQSTFPTVQIGDGGYGLSSYGGNSYHWTSASGGFIFGQTTGSELMRISSNGKVGIGTTSPFASLSVVGTSVSSWVTSAQFNAGNNADGAGSVIGLQSNGGVFGGKIYGGRWSSTDRGLQLTGINQSGVENANIHINAENASSFISFSTASSEKMRIDNSGNVGIGTTSPYAKLSVAGEVVGQMFTATSSTATSTLNGALTVGGAHFNIDATGKTVIGAGIGTFPLAGDLLTVWGNANISPQASTARLLLTTNSGTGNYGEVNFGLAGAAGTDSIKGYGTDHLLTFSTNGNERVRIDSSGNVGIGTTTPGAKLNVQGDILVPDTGSGLRWGVASNGYSKITGNAFAITTYSNRIQLQTTGGNTVVFDGGFNLDTIIRPYSSSQNIQLAPSGGNVGIGTTSPYATLSIQGPATATTLFSVASSTSSSLFSILPNGNTIISPNPTLATPLTISARSVGGSFFGTPSLDSNGAPIFVNGVAIGDLGAIGGGSTSVGVGTQTFYNSNSVKITGGTALAGFAFNLGSDATFQGPFLINNGSGTELMRVMPTGNVGIGTTTPYAKLSIAGDLALTGGIYDNNATRGTNGQVLQTTGSGVQWVATSTLGFASAGSYITDLTGDGTATGPGSAAFTLATINSNIGTFNNVTVNGKGLVTSASNIAYLTTNQAITLSGDVSGSGTTAITTTIGTNKVTSSMIVDNTIAAADLASGDFSSKINSGTYSINITGNATGYAGSLIREDNRLISPSEVTAGQMKFGFTSYNNNNASPYADFLHFNSYTDSTGGADNLLVFNKTSGLGIRLYQQAFATTTAYSTYKDIALAENGAVANYLTKYSGTGNNVSITNSLIYDNGTNIGIGTTTPSQKLSVSGTMQALGGYYLKPTTGSPGYGTYFQMDSTNFNTVASGTMGGGSDYWTIAGTGTSDSGSALKISSGDNGDEPIIFSQMNGATEFERMRIGSNGNVGIGTSSPYAKLSVAGTIVGDSFLGTSTAASSFGGNVGIGTTNPQNLLDVYSGANQLVYIKQNGTASGLITANNLDPADPTAGVSTGANFGFNGSSVNFFGMGLGAVRNSAYDMWFQTGAINGGGFRWYTGTSEHMTLDKNGNLGIGTSTPGSLLSLGGIANFTTATSTFYGTGGLNLAAGCFAVNGTCLTNSTSVIGSGTTGQFPYYAANGTTLTATSSLFLANNGNVGVGTTSPTSRFTVDGNSDLNGFVSFNRSLQFAGNTTNATISAYNTGTNINFSPGGSTSLLPAGNISITGGFGNSNNGGNVYLYGGDADVTAGNVFLGINSSGTAIGKVGIGTTSPSQVLSVAGNGLFSGTLSASNLSGTNTGNVTLSGENYLSLTGQAITVGAVNLSGTNVTGTLAAGRFPALTGDITTIAGALATTLKNTGTSGTYRSVTTDAQGRVTAGTNPTTFAGYGLSDTSANLATVLTNETGTGSAVFNTSPTFATSVFDPLLIGGTGTTQSLILRSTSGIGATGADIIFQTGNNGATEAMRILNSGNVGIGTTSPATNLAVAGNGYFTQGLGVGVLNTAAGTLQTSGPVTVGGQLNVYNSSIQGYSSGGGSNDSVKVVSNNAGAGFAVQNLSGSGYSGIEYIGSDSAVKVFTGYNNANPGEFRFNNIAASGFITFKINGTDRLTINNSGTITLSSLAGSGSRLVQSDASGNLSSVATSTLGLLGSTAIGNGTTGQFPYYAANGNNLTATSTIFVGTNSNVGIGTTSPTNKLEVNGSIYGTSFIGSNSGPTGSGIKIGASTDINSYVDQAGNGATIFGYNTIKSFGDFPRFQIYNNATDHKILFEADSVGSVAGSDRIQLVPNGGNVGIGTTTPWKTLSIAGDLSLTGGLYDSLASAGSNGMVLQSTGSATKWVATSTLGYQAAGNYITALTGDGTASGPGSAAFTLATVNSNVGTFNNVTVNGKGLVTSASNVAYLTGNQTITLSGDVTGSGTTAIVTTLKNTGTAGTYRSVTTDAQGRVTAGTNPTTFAGYGLSDTSANLAAALTDETGTGANVFAASPTLSGTVTAAAINASGVIAASQFNGSGAGLTGIAANLTAGYVNAPDGDRNAATKLPTTSPNAVRFDFVNASTANGGGNYAGVMTYAPWTGTTASTGDASYQLSFTSTATNGSGIPNLNLRKGIDSTWNSWYTILHSGNFNTYAPTLTGTGASGTWGINITGNAATVTTNANLTGAVTSVGNATSLGSFTSANLATALTDETGSGSAVFSASPTLSGNISLPGGIWNSSGNVGIGTTTPASKLDVLGSLTISGGNSITTNIAANIGQNLSIFPGATSAASTAGGTLALSGGSSGASTGGPVTITSGTGGSASVSGPVTISTPNGFSAGSINMTAGNGTTVAGGSINLTAGSGSSINGTITLATQGTGNIFLNAAGNVSIGTSSPSSKLDVAGDITLSGGNGVTHYVMSGGNNSLTVGTSAVTSNQSGTLNLYTGSTTNGTTAGSINMIAGNSGIGIGGSINIAAGTGPGLGGAVAINSQSASNISLTSGSTGNIILNGSAGGNVGIGTSTPYSKLSVAGTIVGQNFIGTSTSVSSFGGNVGIGTASPAKRLEIQQSNGPTLRLAVAESPTGYFTDFQQNWNSANPFNVYVNNTGNILGVATVGGIQNSYFSNYYNLGFYTGDASFPTAANLRMIVSQSGNVGIGTSTPTALLDVNGNALFGQNVSQGTATPLTVSFGGTYGNSTPGSVNNLKWQMYNDGVSSANTYGIGMSAGLMEFHSGAGAALGFYVNNGSEAMKMLSNGNVGIGNTSPSSKLQVGSGTSNTPSSVAQFGAGITAGNVNALSLVNSANATNGNAVSLNFHTSNAYSATGQINNILESTATAASALSFNVFDGSGLNEKLRLTSAGYLGIGNTNPQSTLHVGATNGFIVYPNWGGSGELPSGGTLFGSYTGNLSFFADTLGGVSGKKVTFGYYDGSQNRSALEVANTSGGTFSNLLLMKSGGNVGIGTTTPGTKLDIFNSSSSQAGVVSLYNSDTTNSNGSYISYFGNTSGAGATNHMEFGRISFVTPDHSYLTNKSDIAFSTLSSGTLSERLRITGSGNVGIGTSSPASKLEVAGDITLSGAARSIVSGQNGTASYGLTVTTGGATSGTTGALVLSSGNASAGGNSGNVTVSSGTATGVSGGITISSPSASGATGSINISTGSAGGGAGNINLSTGSGAGSNGAIALTTQNSGNISLTSGTTGKILLNATNGGNVGIGTSTPYAMLSVAGDVVGRSFTATSTTATSTFAGGLTAGSNGFTVLQNGNVGIGTVAPQYPLSINAPGNGNVLANFNKSTGGDAYITVTTGSDIAYMYQRASGLAGFTSNNGFSVDIYGGSNSVGVFKNSGDVALGGTITSPTTYAGSKMFISGSTGNVGIGTTSPASMLTVAGTASIAPASGFLSLGYPNAQSDTGDIMVARSYTNNYTALRLVSPNGNVAASVGVNDAGNFYAGPLSYNYLGETFNIGTGGPNTGTMYGQFRFVDSNPYSNAARDVIQVIPTKTNTSGSLAIVNISPTYNQVSSTAANTDLLINRSYSSIGSGAQYLFDAQANGASKFNISPYGTVTLNGAITNNGLYNQTMPQNQGGPSFVLTNTHGEGNIFEIYERGRATFTNNSNATAFTITSAVNGIYNPLLVLSGGSTQSGDLQQWISNGSYRAVMTSAGKFGIGTSSPASTLTVVGSACISGGAGSTALCSTTAGTITARVFNTANADLAERYATPDSTVEAGDVVAADLDNNSSVVKASKNGSPILGVISTNPGFLLGSTNLPSDATTTPVALSGRVPVKVNLENGPIKKGDYLAVSSQPGVAMKAPDGMTNTIGVALQDASEPGKITVFVQVGLQNIAYNALNATSTPSTATSTASIVTDHSGMFDSIAAAYISVKDLVAETITATFAKFKRVRVEQGIEMVDQASGDIYCVTIVNGEMKKDKGECAPITTTATSTQSTTSTNTQPPTPTITGPIITPTPTATSTDPAPIITPAPTTPEASSTPSTTGTVEIIDSTATSTTP